MDFSKIEAGKLDLEARPFALPTLVEEVAELLAPRVQAKGLEIAAYLDERLPQTVVGDAARLRQVLLNLAGNAVKFTERGGVAVIAEPGIGPQEVQFVVRDTGIGIAPEAQARIFFEFEQADGGATRRFGGTGLGLAITKRIVERMGGRIGLDSTPGAGSSFHFAVALPPAEDRAASFFAPQLAGVSALIVAPSAIEAPLIARRLGRWGARTCMVPDAKVAAALLPQRHWDAVLVDRALGGAAVEALAQAIGSSVARRVILITPSERHTLASLKAAGFTGYLVKRGLRKPMHSSRSTPPRTSRRGRGRKKGSPSSSPRTTTSTRCLPARCWHGSDIARRWPATARLRSNPGSPRNRPARPTTSSSWT